MNPTYTEKPEFLLNQIEVLRKELKNIRETQKKQWILVEKEVAKTKNLLCPENTERKTSNQRHDTENSSDDGYSFKPISFIRSCYKTKNGTPRQASICTVSKASLTIDKKIFSNPSHSLSGIQEFSHIWLLFVFHQNDHLSSGGISRKAKIKSPRLDGVSVGVFSTRSPHRPCPIGLSLVKLESVEGDTLFLSGVDLVDGTPVLDIKPYIPNYDNPSFNIYKLLEPQKVTPVCELNISNNVQEQSVNPTPINVASWVSKPKLPVLSVLFTHRAKSQLELFHFHESHSESCEYCLEYLKSTSEATFAIESILAEDPRSVYRRNKCQDRLYYFTVDKIHVTCWFDEYEPTVEVLSLRPGK